MPDRVFVDTNVLLSGLAFEGNESYLLSLAGEGDKDLLTDEVRAIAPTCRCADYLENRKD